MLLSPAISACAGLVLVPGSSSGAPSKEAPSLSCALSLAWPIAALPSPGFADLILLVFPQLLFCSACFFHREFWAVSVKLQHTRTLLAWLRKAMPSTQISKSFYRSSEAFSS